MRLSLVVLSTLLLSRAHADPPTAKQLLDQGQKLASHGKLAEAIAAYDAALALAPDDPVALAELGSCTSARRISRRPTR